MSEAQLWNKVRAGLLDAADLKIDLERIENMVGVGTPDVNFCYEGVEGWIELKHTDIVPTRDGTRVFGDKGLRKEQVVWHYKRNKRGGRCWILARCGEAIFLVHGSHCREFNEMTYPQLLAVSTWYHVGRKVDWKGMLEAICS
jgi:hypothetical protein